jgi:carotenoid cleavage dioxygenase-like enzyme
LIKLFVKLRAVYFSYDVRVFPTDPVDDRDGNWMEKTRYEITGFPSYHDLCCTNRLIIRLFAAIPNL